MSRPSCPCGFDRVEGAFSVAWHIDHRSHHLAVYPDVDDVTRWNLQSFIDQAILRAPHVVQQTLELGAA